MRLTSSTAILVISSLSLANVLLPASCFIQTCTPSKSSNILAGLNRNEQKHGIIRRSNSAVLSLRMARFPLIEEWSITSRRGISGTIYNHPNPDIGDGDGITTSTLDSGNANYEKGATIVTISGSKYELGSPKGASKEKIKTNPFNFLNKKDASGGKTRGNGVGKTLALTSDILADLLRNDKDNSASPTNENAMPGLFNFLNKKDESKIKLSGKTIPLKVAQIPLIEDWSITFRGCLSGEIYNHPNPDIDDGDGITTSKLETNRADCKQSVTIVTISGSEYILGSPKGGFKNKFNIASTKEKVKTDESKIKPSGKTIGYGKYFLVGEPKESTSGKSQIWTAYRSSDPLSSSPEPIGRPLVAKISFNKESLARENINYKKATSGFFQGQFVDKIDYLPRAGPDFTAMSALVIEQGAMDLKDGLARLGEGVGMEGRAMRDAAMSAAQCIQAMHASGMVWTDLKAENFVVVFGQDDNGSDEESEGLPVVKAIDLESACPHKKNPIDFSPEACPPEFAKEFVKGDGEFFILDYNYDVWSFGMMMYELSTGYSYFEGCTPSQITRLLNQDDFEVDVSAIKDKMLRDLVRACLNTKPQKRPSINQILMNPYFITTAFGF